VRAFIMRSVIAIAAMMLVACTSPPAKIEVITGTVVGCWGVTEGHRHTDIDILTVDGRLIHLSDEFTGRYDLPGCLAYNQSRLWDFELRDGMVCGVRRHN